MALCLFTPSNTRIRRAVSLGSLKCHVMSGAVVSAFSPPLNTFGLVGFLDASALCPCGNFFLMSAFLCVHERGGWRVSVWLSACKWWCARKCIAFPEFTKIQTALADLHVTHLTNRSRWRLLEHLLHCVFFFFPSIWANPSGCIHFLFPTLRVV